jgi:ATP-dependent DNA ligase
MLCKTLKAKDLPLFLKAINNNRVGETKENGDRIRLVSIDGKISLINRRGIDVSFRYPEITELKLPNVILDGEICVYNLNHKSIFYKGIDQRSHINDINEIKEKSKNLPVTYVVFDILNFDNKDVRNLKLKQRRKILEKLTFNDRIKLIEQTKNIRKLWKKVIKEGHEGIVIKDLESVYEERRSFSWLKVKSLKEEDIRFTKYERNTTGVRCLAGEVSIQVQGSESDKVAKEIDTKGFCNINVNYLDKVGDSYVQIVFEKIMEDGIDE